MGDITIATRYDIELQNLKTFLVSISPFISRNLAEMHKLLNLNLSSRRAIARLWTGRKMLKTLW